MTHFKDLKPGYQVPYLTTSDPLSSGKAKVISVGMPQPDRKNPSSMQLVLDLTLSIDGSTRTYTIPDGQDTAYGPDIIICTDNEGILRELLQLRTQAESELEKTSHYQKILKQAGDLIVDLDPVARQKRETESRMEKLESGLAALTANVASLLDRLT